MIRKSKPVILVIDDVQMTVRMAVKDLKDGYEVITAESGEEGFELLMQNKDVISLVLLDIILPKMNGFEFLEKMKKEALSHIPVIIMTAAEETHKEVLALRNGAADFIRKPLYPEILQNRIHNVLMRNQMEFDSLTGLYNRRRTFTEIKEMIKANPDKKYSFVRYDIDNFSNYNSSMGEDEGNRLLLRTAEIIKELSNDYKECVYGRIDGDVFCMCEVYNKELLENHISYTEKALSEYRKDYRLEASFGIYVFDNPEMCIENIYAKATIAARTCKGIYNKHFEYYKKSMDAHFAEEQTILNEMTAALNEGQFIPYLQPKYDLDSDALCGAEALVRWNHPKKGILAPARFIPIFERNGFIAKLDYYMWDSVCMLLGKWKKIAKLVYPISVNISRISMHNPNLAKVFTDLIKKYDITPDLLQLEITESAYMSNPSLMKQNIQSLHNNGFTILMDDFGSGYSSLNTLKEINVDILKVDMKLLPSGETKGRSEKILSSIIRMSSWLEIPTIVEGVETEEQRDFLKGIGCDFVQGYYYAKPMTVSDYEEIISSGMLTVKKSTEKNHESAVWSSDQKVNEILSCIQLPVAIVEYSPQIIEVIRINLLFGSTFGKNLNEILKSSECEIIRNAILSAVKNGVSECEFSYKTITDKNKYYRMKTKRLGKTDAACLLCVIIVDITLEKLYQKQLKKLDELVQSTVRNKMLVIDDSSVMRDTVRAMFNDTYDVLEAENGAEGLKLLQTYKDSISIILLDMIMPVMNGKSFLTEKKKLIGTDNIPVIVMSADDADDMQLDMLASGVNDYITKPFNIKIFKQKVKNATMYAERFAKIRNEYERLLKEESEID